MRNNNIELLIFIKGQKAAIEYQSPRDFQSYIEGREGSEFEIEVRNHNAFRVEAVVTVDGLSVLNGEMAGDDSSGYVINAHSSVRIPGWLVNNQKAAKFEFSGRKGGTYVEQSTGQATNKGVIGLMVFEEITVRRREPMHFPVQTFRSSGGFATKGMSRSSGMASRGSAIDPFFGAATLNNSGMSYSNNASLSASNASLSASMACGSTDTASSYGSDAAALHAQAAIAQAQVQQTLGTAFGEATEFVTQNVSFARGDMLVLMWLYYDDKRGLEKRGIQVVRPSQVRYESRPNPFPNMNQGCTPPENWRG